MVNKTTLYKKLLARQVAAHEAKFYFEACWFAYAIFEDRMDSISKNSAPNTTYDNLKTKIKKIRNRLGAAKPPKNLVRLRDDLLDEIDIWRELRNDLMHGLAHGEVSMEDADENIRHLSQQSLGYTKELSSAARWIKKHNK